MKILMIVGQADPDFTVHCGIGDYAARLVRELLRAGHAVQVLTSSRVVGSACADAGSNPGLASDWGIRQSFHLRRIAAHWRPDIVHLQYQPDLYQRKPWVPLYPLLVKTIRPSSIFVTTFHSIQHPSKLSPTRLYAQELLWLSDGIVVTNVHHRDQIIRPRSTLSRKLVTIPVSTNIALHPISDDRRLHLRYQLGAGRDAIILAHFGFPREDKGLRYVIESLADLRRQGVSAYFVHLGEVRPTDRPHVAELTRLADQLGVSDRSRWLGILPENEVSAYLQVADIYVAPYDDGFSPRRTSAIVALAHGLPIVTTTGGSVQAELDEGPAAVFVPPRDTAGLSAALGQLAADPAWRASLGLHARQFAAQYDWEHIRELHESFYGQLMHAVRDTS